MDIFEFITTLAAIYDIYALLNDGLIISCYVFCIVLIIIYIIYKGIDFIFMIVKAKILNKDQINNIRK